VDQTVERMRAKGSLQRRYEQILAARSKQKLQVPNITSADTVLARASAAPLNLQQARQLLLESLRPVGKDYTHRFAELLDPKNGRLDLTGGEHRAHTGTSISAYDAPVAFYYEGYDGSLNSVRVIAHEGGHAIHRELMNANGIPVYQREGPHYLFEGFAMLNELLLFDHAADVAKSPEERRYALEGLLSKLSDDLFVTTEETSFERSLYTMAVGHALLTQSQIDSAYQKAVAPFEYWPVSDTGASYNWIRKALLFEDPLYEVNYLYAALVAVALYEHAHSDPDFAAKYEQLLRRGFYAEPTRLLATMKHPA
jgi:oligoendopeptidase F